MKTVQLAIVASLVLILVACSGEPQVPPDPTAPTNVRAVPGDGFVTVLWDFGGTEPEAFVVQREAIGDGVAPQAYEDLGEVEGDAREFRDDRVATGTRHRYRVLARDGDRLSSASAASAPTRIPPRFEAIVGTYSVDDPGLPDPVTSYLFLAHDPDVLPPEGFELRVQGPPGWNDGSEHAFHVAFSDFIDGIGIYADVDLPLVTGTYTTRATLNGTEYVTTAHVDASRAIEPIESTLSLVQPDRADITFEPMAGVETYRVRLDADDVRMAHTTDSSGDVTFTDVDLELPGEYHVNILAYNVPLPDGGPLVRPYPQFDLSVGFSDRVLVPYDEATFHPVDPRGTYLLMAAEDDGVGATVLTLEELGAEPGQCLGLMRTGAYQPHASESSQMPDASSSLTAVFAGPDGALAPGEAGEPTGVFTWENTDGEDTDIPEDFEVRARRRFVQVPAGATELWLGTLDTFYGDNADPNGDFGVMAAPEVCP